MTNPWMTVKELASYIKISTDLIYKLAHAGEIPVSKVGNRWRFHRDEIDEWLKNDRKYKGGKKR